MKDQPDNRLAQRLSLMMIKTIEHHTLFIWGGLLTLMLSVANMATTALTSPGPIDSEEITTSAASSASSPSPITLEAPLPPPVESPTTVESPTVQFESNTQTDNNLLPLWLAIAIGCVSSSVFISKQLHRKTMPSDRAPSRRDRRQSQRIRRHQSAQQGQGYRTSPEATAEDVTQGNKLLSSRSRVQAKTAIATTQKRSTIPQKNVSRIGREAAVEDLRSQRFHSSFSAPDRPKAPGTFTRVPQQAQMEGRPQTMGEKLGGDPPIDQVVLADKSHESPQAESREKSLAEMMDIRKRQSLSSVLGDSKVKYQG